MKPLIALLVLSFSSAAFAGPHVYAPRVVWVDKIAPSRSSHNLRQITPYVKVRLPKTINHKGKTLEVGEVAEVGWHRVKDGSLSYAQDGWRDQALQSFMGSKDYFSHSVTVSHGLGLSWGLERGAYYVRTTKGITFWHKPSNRWGDDYYYDTNAANILEGIWTKAFPGQGSQNYNAGPHRAIPTQRSDMRYYNPEQAR